MNPMGGDGSSSNTTVVMSILKIYKYCSGVHLKPIRFHLDSDPELHSETDR